MPENAPRLEDVRAAIEALSGDPVATLRDLVGEVSDTTVAVDTLGTTLEALRLLVDGLLNIPEAELPATGQLKYPEFVADYLPSISTKLTGMTSQLNAVIARLNGPDSAGGGNFTGITSITNRLTNIQGTVFNVEQGIELIAATVFAGTRLTDIFDRMAEQHTALMAQLGTMTTELTRLADCACGTEPPPPAIPSCMPPGAVRQTGWIRDPNPAVLSSINGYILHPTFDTAELLAAGIIWDTAGDPLRGFAKVVGSGAQVISVGWNTQSDIGFGAAVVVRNFTSATTANVLVGQPLLTSPFDVFEAFPGGLCETFDTFDIGTTNVQAGDKVVTFGLFVPDTTVDYDQLVLSLGAGNVGS